MCAPSSDAVEEVYSITDLMVCRAGGMTVAEVTACGIPAIFIPLPSQTGNDQVLNAHSVAEKGAAVVLEQGKFTVEMLVETLTHILLDQNIHEQMVAASRGLGKPSASDEHCQIYSFVCLVRRVISSLPCNISTFKGIFANLTLGLKK